MCVTLNWDVVMVFLLLFFHCDGHDEVMKQKTVEEEGTGVKGVKNKKRGET